MVNVLGKWLKKIKRECKIMIVIRTVSQVIKVSSNDLEKVVELIYPLAKNLKDLENLGVVSITKIK